MQKSAGEAEDPDDESTSRVRVPAPLTVAVSLAMVEALVMVGYAVAEVASLSADYATQALATAACFALYGVGLGYSAWSLYRLRSWARSPVVFGQLLQLAIATGFWGGRTTGVAIVLGVVALVTAVGVLHPASIDALADPE